MPKAVICIPTYNEKDNLESLLPKMREIIESRSLDAIILIIDDNSPDGTADVAREFMKRTSTVDLLFRQTKEGLGRAYIAAFEYAMKKYTPSYIFEMDADLSHPPEVFPAMLEALEQGRADFVVGSRKVPGGGTVNWGMHRRLTSNIGNTYARLLLRLPIKDVTSGYRGFRSEFLKRINLQSVNSGGYSFQIEMAYLVTKLLRARSAEVPITFVDRKIGKSKLGMKDIVEFFLLAFRLSFFGWRRRQKLLT